MADGLNLYLLSQTTLDGYETYDSCVVCASSADDAKSIPLDYDIGLYHCGGWPDSVDVIVCEQVGVALPGMERGVVLASYRAG